MLDAHTPPKRRGSPIAADTIAAARAARSAKRDGANAAARSAIASIQRAGIVTLDGIARKLEGRGILTPGRQTTWRRVQVARLVKAIRRDTVAIVIVCDSVFLPLDAEGSLRIGRTRAAPARVKRGARLQAPVDLAASLESRGQVSIDP
jgi:hypothetical protein